MNLLTVLWLAAYGCSKTKPDFLEQMALDIDLFDPFFILPCFTSQASFARSRNYAMLSKRPDILPQYYLACDKSQSIELAKEDSPAIPRLVQIAPVDLALP